MGNGGMALVTTYICVAILVIENMLLGLTRINSTSCTISLSRNSWQTNSNYVTSFCTLLLERGLSR